MNSKVIDEFTGLSRAPATAGGGSNRIAMLRGVGVALLAAVIAACSRGETKPMAGPPPSPVSVAKVIAKDVKQWDEFSGRVEAVQSVEVRPRVGGYVELVNFREGAEVKSGDILFVIDRRPYQAEYDRASAELMRAKAAASLAKTEVARAEKLLATHVISQEEHDQRTSNASQTGAGVKAAEAALETARLNLDFTQVRAPISGRIGQALVTAGNLVTTAPQSTLLTTIVSLDPVYVYFDGDEQTYLRYADLARKGERPSSRDVPNPVFVGLSNETGYPHSGHVDFVDNQVNAQTGTIRARAVLENKDRVFTPGLFARVRLVASGDFHALLIDDKAVLTDQDRKFVYVLGPENKALRKDVKLGRVIDGLRVVTEGLAESDQVIVHGVQKVFFPGMTVAPTTITMGDAPAIVAMK